MDEKRREAGNSPAGPSSAEPEPASTRRRGGALKRKANSLSGSSSSSTPSKRITREKSNLISHSPINHYGPLTRARQGAPGASQASGLGPGSGGAKLEEISLGKECVKAEDLEELNKASEEWEALEAKIEAEFEAIRSRDSNAHVVPNHCGWFSWTKIHNVEERVLPSFFNGKNPMRTPDVYMEIRNWILKKFHANPSTQIELKDLSDLEVGDLDARQEVLEFLDYWGLINFHPFPPVDSTLPTADGDGTAKTDSLLDKLFHFEAIESRPPVVACPNPSTPSVPSGFFPESAIAEDLVRPEGPPEYHCNSCSADCSRKRYHCQKQADFDLCTDCFNNGKFGSGMSSSDFILMEPAEVPGLTGGKWTDQETLLLLEALELYKENWNEIAEHVATKTKAQCILHFVQMPIEDVFFDSDGNVDANSKEAAGPAAMSDEASVPKEAPETTESKATPQEDQAETTPMETSKPEDEKEVRVETSNPEPGTDAKVGPETSKPEETNEAKDGQETDENCALIALREAFEAVGYLSTSESSLSFTDVGNPVMALAGFFARLVGPNNAAASAQNSLKSLSCSSPNIQLAARNCFLLEDPPDDKKEPTVSESVVNDMANRDSQNVENMEEGSLKEDKSSPVSDQKNSLSNHVDQNAEVSPPEEKVTSSVSPNDLPSDKKEPSTLGTSEEVKKANLNDSSTIDQSKDNQPNVIGQSDNASSQVPPGPVEETGGKKTSVEDPSQPTGSVREVDMSDSVPLEKNEPCDAAASKPVGEQSKPAEVSESVEKVSDSPSRGKNEQQPVKLSSLGEPTQATEAPNDVEMVSDSQPLEQSEPQQQVGSNAVKENGATTDEKGGKNENHDSTETKADLSIDKVKRAAVTALAAAAVKAKLLAEQEEDQIRQLTTSLIEKKMTKMESKLAFFNELEGVMMRVKEQLDRSRQRLYHERAQIIAARLGLPASSSRAMPPSNTANRIATNFANSVARPPMSMIAPRPPMSRPLGPMTPTPSNPFVSTTVTGSSIRPASSDNLSSVESK
ncbi:Zinc finger, ZZ-type [Corchorus capsularis]|uniref:Zinc finger, ZZ-type n=1 Tax=Corchorus capsularis TaxID=210143 RepID=A0A1R3HVI3_COCAP|nr:Zinc finger, ZZ-type [Corchorus capsularis]